MVAGTLFWFKKKLLVHFLSFTKDWRISSVMLPATAVSDTKRALPSFKSRKASCEETSCWVSKITAFYSNS